jgi:hypothetical protein
MVKALEWRCRLTDVLLTIHSVLVCHEIAHTQQLLETFTKDTKGQGAAKLYEVLCIEAVFCLSTGTIQLRQILPTWKVGSHIWYQNPPNTLYQSLAWMGCDTVTPFISQKLELVANKQPVAPDTFPIGFGVWKFCSKSHRQNHHSDHSAQKHQAHVWCFLWRSMVSYGTPWTHLLVCTLHQHAPTTKGWILSDLAERNRPSQVTMKAFYGDILW